MTDGNAYLNALLQHYRQQLKEQKKELKTLPPGRLALRKEDGTIRYMQVQQKNDGTCRTYTRKGITKNQRLVHKLARKKYLELSIKTLTNETAKLERFLRNWTAPDGSNILRQLPEDYQRLPPELFLPEKRSVNKWAAAEYEQNPYYAHEKIHITSKGLKVRSKSELLIAEKLDAYQIPYRYDAMVYFESYSFSPDFMVPTTEGMKYWEHCGMMSVPAYKHRNKKKLAMYEKIGIVPWKNLLITYDSEDGGMNLAIIEAEIINKLLPILV